MTKEAAEQMEKFAKNNNYKYELIKVDEEKGGLGKYTTSINWYKVYELDGSLVGSKFSKNVAQDPSIDSSKNNAIEELKKFSTHPIFETRYEIIDNNTTGNIYNFNKNYQRECDFIQAKFMAYTESGMISKLKEDQKIYYDSIQLSKSGNLLESLKKINFFTSS